MSLSFKPPLSRPLVSGKPLPTQPSPKPDIRTAHPPPPPPEIVRQALESPSEIASAPNGRVRLTSPPPIRTAPPSEVEPAKPTSQSLPTENIQATFRQLSHAAVDLNAASDDLSKPISLYEAALKKLNLGISEIAKA